ncbi:DUF4845 domain-containing protein [Massilia sp. PWRC2]|uniref:DUF4845 domain-containing protein n=1 Tax=Massilia sp. PWRC2 TaxID=2804626 RepID=UPI003CF5E7EB
MHTSTLLVSLRKQRGISLTGLIFVLALLGFIGVTGMKVFPALLEYKSSTDAIKAAKATNGTPEEMRQSFNRFADINRIDSITGKDLLISKETGDTEVSFAYQKKIPLFANASLLLDFASTTARSGINPAAAAAADPK